MALGHFCVEEFVGISEVMKDIIALGILNVLALSLVLS